jgi:DNA-binding response OmpR family regulator
MTTTVIIVDDDSFYAEILGDLLQMQGYESRHFLSGETCLQVLDSHAADSRIDAFILDVVMPDMDGYALCEKLRAHPRFERTPILFVSSKSSLEDRMRGYEAGGNDYLGKPAQPEELKAKLKLAIDGAGGKPPSAASPTVAAAVSERVDAAGLQEFLGVMLTAQTIDAIATFMLETMSSMGINVSLLIRGDNGSLFQSNDGSRSPIEKELLELASQNQLMIEFNKRLIINLPVVAMLVRRLPEVTPSGIAALKDLLLLMLRVAEQKAAVVRQDEAMAQQKAYWVELLVAAEQGIQQVKNQSSTSAARPAEVLDDFLLTVNEAILDLALDQDQEQQLKALLKHNIDKAVELLSGQTGSADDVQKPLRALINQLSLTL